MMAEAMTATHELIVDLGERSYPIWIGQSLLGQAGLLDGHLAGGEALVVTNPAVSQHYLGRLVASLPAKAVADVVSIGDGEAFKTMSTVTAIIDKLVAARHSRATTVVALGGGVVGDVAGFAAAIYQRGVRFVQVPTTLLALVDSSVGGKTGVNHSAGKNLIGAFHQPACVVADVDTLQTLPQRELRAGLAEVVKCGVIQDAGFFAWLEGNVERLLALDPDALGHAIRRSCEIKADIVQADEREAGRRMILNFGHTFAHALEALTHYRTLLHGEAVAIGMLMAAHLAKRINRLSAAEMRRIRQLIRRCGLPETPPAVDSEAMLAAMSMDKKARGGRIRFVLPNKIGAVSVTGAVPREAVLETLEAFRAQSSTPAAPAS